MRAVFGTLLCILFVGCCFTSAKDYFSDERGRMYVIGVYGERVYEDSEGNMIVENNRPIKVEFNSDKVTDFGWKLFNSTNDESKVNTVISPLSPQLLLSLVAKESEGKTKTEITDAAGTEGMKLEELVKVLLAEETARELDVASALFINVDLKNQLKDTYKYKEHGAHVEPFFMDFKNPKKLQTKYDQWVKTKTNGRISAGSLKIDPNSQIVMSSAMFFRGDWIFQFEKFQQAQFTNSRGRFQVDMMRSTFQKYHYGYLSDDLGEWLSIPYNSTESMLILLPNKTRNLNIDEMIRRTPTSDITDIIDIIRDTTIPNTVVNITMPMFKVESESNLKEGLSKMGIKKIFSRNSEFYPLKDNQSLAVSDALQYCSLEVNEKGSVGASVTKFSIAALSVKAPLEKVNFVVDRPFLAVIVNKLYRVPYFIAKITDPRQ